MDGNSNVCGIEGQLKQKRKEREKVTNKDLQKVGNSFAFINDDMFSQIDIVKNSYKKMEIIIYFFCYFIKNITRIKSNKIKISN
jgi:hypothetical protein